MMFSLFMVQSVVVFNIELNDFLVHKKEINKHPISQIRGDIQIPFPPNNNIERIKEIIINTKPLDSDIIVANSGFSIETQKPEHKILKPNNKNDVEYNLKANIESLINLELPSVINKLTICGANIKHNIKIVKEIKVMVLKESLSKYLIEFTSFFP